MSDEPHTIPDHVAARVARLINEAEDMRKQAADDLKQIYADLRDELRGMGWVGSAVSAEVAALKGAISEMRLAEADKTKREEKSERIGDYVSMLSRARAREGQSYADAKLVETVAKGVQTEIGRKALVTALDAMIEAEDGGEITEHEQPETVDEFQAKASEDNGSITGGAGAVTGEASRLASGRTDAGEAASVDLPTHSNPQPFPLSGADKPEAVSPPIPQAVSGAISADDVPAFIKRDYVLRPHCLNPSLCAGTGREHCHRCKRAMAESEAA